MPMRAGEMPLPSLLMPSLPIPSLVPTIIRASFVLVLARAGYGTPAPVRADPGSAAPSAARLERLSEFFDNEVATGKLAGAIVLIQQHGRLIYFKCFGVRDVATKQPMT